MKSRIGEAYDLARLERERRMRGLSFSELARKSGLKPPTVTKVLTVHKGAETSVIKIAAALSIGMAEITREPVSAGS